MPDHCYNNITIRGTKESVAKVKNRILVTEDYVKEIKRRNEGLKKDFQISIPDIGKLSFNRLIPAPNNIYFGPLSDEEEKKYGKENCWLEWSYSHWGNKWDAYSQIIKMKSEEVLSLDCCTAWCPPVYYLISLAKVCLEEGCDMKGDYDNYNIGGEYYIDKDKKFYIELGKGKEFYIDLVEDF